jgi:transposase
MHGREREQHELLTTVSLEERIPESHPIRRLRRVTDEVLAPLKPGLRELYAHTGRPGIPPEYLLRALILQAVFSIRSERQLVEQLEYNLLFRWFVGLGLGDRAWDATTFTKNRQRLMESEVGQAFLSQTVLLAQAKGLTDDERFVVDGTLIKAYAGMKSFKKDPGDPDDFSGTKRSNETHTSTTDPDARLLRKGKGQESMLCYLASLMMDVRHGLVRSVRTSVIATESEVDAALAMAQGLPGRRPVVAADKGYDCGKFRDGLAALAAVGHPAPKARGSSVDSRTTRHESFRQSMRVRPHIEKVFGWIKQEGRMRQTRFRGRPKVALQFELAASAYNILRMANLSA